MHTRGKGRNSLEKQRIPLDAPKCVFTGGGEDARVCGTHTLLFIKNNQNANDKESLEIVVLF